MKKQIVSTPWRRYLAMCILPVAFTLRASAQDAASDKKIPVETVPTKPGATTEDEDLVVLSPFTVSTDKDKGYFAENTLAGSRMKTKLSDLGASISVVTKSQMEDFASTDINDVFRYEVNTEGSGTYTPQTRDFRGDGILDVNAGGTQGNNSNLAYTNASANRVRGLGIPSTAINYYPSNGAVPADAYNTASFEISRGPNSMLFGVGSPAGVVNQSTQQASLTHNNNRVVIAIDDRGSFRTSLAFNRTLFHNKLAFYGAALWDDRRFERKPSYDKTRRLYGALTYKPFSKTVIRANFEDYDNRNRRPNTISPIDLVSQWNLAGRPTYDALNKTFTFLSTGAVQGPYLSSASSVNNPTANAQMVRNYIRSLPSYNAALIGGAPSGQPLSTSNFTTYNGVTIFGQTAINTLTSALYVPGVAESNQGRSTYQIADGRVQNWYQPLYTQSYRRAFGTATNPVAAAPLYPSTNADLATVWASPTLSDVYNRDSFQSAGWTGIAATSGISKYLYPGVTDRGIYDWKKINVTEANFGSQKNRNYNVDVEQEITKELFLSGGWFRQDWQQTSNYTISQLNATALTIDVNKYLPNGTPNPYFGLPFVWDRDPDQYLFKQVDDHFRGMLAYTPDFTNKDGWLKWLGRHQIIGMWSRDESMGVAYRKRLNYIAADPLSAAYRYLPNPNNNTDGSRTGWSYYTTGAVTERHFYLANPGDPIGKATRSTGEWNAERYSGSIQVFNYGSGAFEDANVTQAFNTFDAPQRTQKILNSLSTGMTNYFWKDRLVTTFGARLDKFKARQTTGGTITLDDGTVVPALTPQDKFTPDGFFDDNSIWNRFNKWFRITGRTKTGGGVLRPFSGWAAIDRRANNGNQFWQFVQNFGVSYNWSNNFNTPNGPENDAFGKQLDKPYGVGHDLGFQFSALNGKLFARATWFTATNLNQRGVGSNTALTRFNSNVDTTLFRNWARTIAIINSGLQDPRNDGFDSAGSFSPAQELAIQADTEVIWKQSYNYYNNLPGAITTTGDSQSKGMEVQVNYNSGNWRNRMTFGKQETTNSNVSKQYDAWYAQRAPIMMAAKASDYLLPQYQNLATYHSFNNTDPTPNVDLTNFWTSYGFNSAVKRNDANGNTNVSNYYAINLTPLVLLATDLNGQAAPNQRKYHWAYNTGYDFTFRRLKGFGIGGAERWESKSVIGYYGKASHSNTALPNLLDISDVSRPIYDKANYYTDLFVKYRRKIWNERIDWSVQLNVENVFENGHLQTVAVNYDGSPYGYRIIDSRKFTLTSTFDF